MQGCDGHRFAMFVWERWPEVSVPVEVGPARVAASPMVTSHGIVHSAVGSGTRTERLSSELP